MLFVYNVSMSLYSSMHVNQSRLMYFIGCNGVVKYEAHEGCSLLDHDTHLWVSDQQPVEEQKDIYLI